MKFRNYISKLMILAFPLRAISGISCLAQDERMTSEAVRVEHYSNAPIQCEILRVWVKPGGSEEWVETCFQYSALNKTKKIFDSYSWSVGPKGETAGVMGKTFVVPKPLQSVVAETCVPNNVRRDEGQFMFRLDFVERKGKTVWESEEHRRESQRIDELVKKSRPKRIP